MNRDRVIGTFLGAAIGDALGMPVETMTPELILKRYPQTGGRITEYIAPTGHKWFDGRKPGTWTDDCQLTLAVAKGLMESDGFIGTAMNSQVEAHIEAFKQTTAGWGGTTREAVRNLSNGIHWTHSGIVTEGRGKGNGVIMKLAPIAIVMRQQYNTLGVDFAVKVNTFVRDLTIMTHPTRMAVAASFAHFRGLLHCLGNSFSPLTLSLALAKGAEYSLQYTKNLPEETDDIISRLDKLTNFIEQGDPQTIRNEFGGGSCYCFDSLPFTYAFFLRNPDSIESLYDCISAGGDADSNGSMLGSMLGARFGTRVFPEHLIKRLDQVDEILAFANQFCDQFSIK